MVGALPGGRRRRMRRAARGGRPGEGAAAAFWGGGSRTGVGPGGASRPLTTPPGPSCGAERGPLPPFLPPPHSAGAPEPAQGPPRTRRRELEPGGARPGPPRGLPRVSASAGSSGGWSEACDPAVKATPGCVVVKCCGSLKLGVTLLLFRQNGPGFSFPP